MDKNIMFQKFVSDRHTLGKKLLPTAFLCLQTQDARPGTPVFVFLSPGVDVAAAVEALGHKLGFTAEKGLYTSVSLGQGQEPIAEQRLEHAHKHGGWVLLQNIHLTIDWTTSILDARVDKLSEGAHPDFRWGVHLLVASYLLASLQELKLGPQVLSMLHAPDRCCMQSLIT